MSSYFVLSAGVALLLVGELLRLDDALTSARKLGNLIDYLPAYSGGYLLTLVGFLSVMRDVRRGQHALRGERDFIRGIIETNEVLIIGMSLEDGRIVMFNKGAERVTGYSRQEVLGRPYREVFLAPEDRSEAVCFREAIRSGRHQGVGVREQYVIVKSGERRLISWTYTVCREEGERQARLAAFGRDVTEQRQMQERLEKTKADLERVNRELDRLASTDYLTGLVNRRLAATLLDREAARARRYGTALSVILMDLDGFKAINDAHGHEAGDAALKHVARLLGRRLRAADVAARYGGDEFFLLFAETGVAGASLLAETVRDLIEGSSLMWQGSRIPVTASIGLAVCGAGQQMSPHDLIRRADQAMYRAKRLGGNRVATWGCQEPEETPLEKAPR
jgi:diguanylate cyclase (GGDEF)-like protein/PAS domain S-box-containing protein